MELQLFQKPPRLLGRERLLQRRSRGRVPVVQHQADPPGLRRVHVHQISDESCPVPFGSAITHPHVTLATPRLATPEQAAHPRACVLGVQACWLARPRGQRQRDLSGGLHPCTPPGTAGRRARRTFPAHPPDARRTGHEPGAECTTSSPGSEGCRFFNALRTVSRETFSTNPSMTSRPQAAGASSHCVLQVGHSMPG
jgi:hypothetical protein